MTLLDILFLFVMVLSAAFNIFIWVLGAHKFANILVERIDKRIMRDDKEIKVAKVNNYCGETYARCPHCDMENAMVGMIPVEKRKGYQVYSCERCGGLFRVG